VTRLNRRIAVIFSVALALVPLLLFMYLGLHNRLIYDDYLHLGLARDLGAWKAMLIHRELWNGDHSNFLLYGVLAHFGIAAPPLFALILCASAFVGFSWLTSTILARQNIRAHRRKVSIVLAALTTAAAINAFYHQEAFHFLTPSVEYTWPAVMLLLGIALAVATARRLRGRVQHILAAIAAALYAFVNAGFSEIYLVFQLTAVALIAIYVFVFHAGPKRKSYVILAAASLLGTIADLPVQLTTSGVAYRSSLTNIPGYLVIPVRDLPNLLDRTLHLTLNYVVQEASFAGFMLVVFAGLFLTLSLSNRSPVDSKMRQAHGVYAPSAFALVVQLLFAPILWSHQSDALQILGRYSYAFMLVVCFNLVTIAVLLALLWRRKKLAESLNNRSGLTTYCSVILLVVCLLLAMPQVRSIHFKASSYMFVTVASLLIMLNWQLTLLAAEPRLKRLLPLSAFATAGAMITLASLHGVSLWGAGYIWDRNLTAAVFALMLAGLVNGVALGVLIRHGFWLTGPKTIRLRWLRLFCLLVVIPIAANIVIGHGQRISQVRKDAEHWDASHQEILRLRDEGDPAVYTKKFRRLHYRDIGIRHPRYQALPLSWVQLIYYKLLDDKTLRNYRCPNEVISLDESISHRANYICMAYGING